MFNGFYQELEELRADGMPDASFGFLENVDVGEAYNLYDFLHGHCDQFAAGLSDFFGYEIEYVVGDADMLIHAYCVTDIGGKKAYIDARGITTDADLFFDEFADWCNYDADSGLLYDLNGECQVFRHNNTQEMYSDENRELNQDKDLYQFLKDNRSYYDVKAFEREASFMVNKDSLLRQALDAYRYDVDVALGDAFILRHVDEIIYGYQKGVSEIDLDFWMQYEELLGDKMSYEEYLFIDFLYEGDPLELVDATLSKEEKVLFGQLKAALDDYRAGKVNDAAVGLLVEAYKEHWTPDKSDDVYEKIKAKAGEAFAEVVCRELEAEYSSWFEKSASVDGLIGDAKEKAASYNEAKKLEEHTYGNHIFMRLEVDGEVHEVSNYAGRDGKWDSYKTTADGTDKRDAVIQAFEELY